MTDLIQTLLIIGLTVALFILAKTHRTDVDACLADRQVEVTTKWLESPQSVRELIEIRRAIQVWDQTHALAEIPQ